MTTRNWNVQKNREWNSWDIFQIQRNYKITYSLDKELMIIIERADQKDKVFKHPQYTWYLLMQTIFDVSSYIR